MTTFQRLYDSEINFAIACFWDGGFDIRLGDALNGYAAEGHVDRWDEIEPWLQAQACRLYPESRFAKETVTSV